MPADALRDRGAWTRAMAAGPQGLKSLSFCVVIGTTEVVPFPVVSLRWFALVRAKSQVLRSRSG